MKNIFRRLTGNGSIKRTFLTFSVIFFLIIFAAGTVTFVIAMRRISTEAIEDKLTLTLETLKLHLANNLNSEIALVVKLADTPLIRRHMLNPDNPELARAAFEEFDAYRRNFISHSIFWISDIDKKLYFDYSKFNVVDPKEPNSYWYNKTLYETEKYNLNVNRNSAYKKTNLWINAPVFANGKAVGMLGTGMDLPNFVKVLYQTLNSDISVYIVNAQYEIAVALDQSLVFNKTRIDDHLGALGIEIADATKRLGPSQSKIITWGATKCAISAIPQFGWYIIGMTPVTTGMIFDDAMTALFVAALLLIILIFTVCNVFIFVMKDAVDEQNRQLIALNKTAQAASKAKSDFLSRMSHEIRTPMSAVIGMSELAEVEYGKPKCLEYITGIRRAGANLLAIINDILDVSRIEADKFSLNLAPYETASLLNDALTAISIQFTGKPVDFITEIDPSLPEVMTGDGSRVRQILLNLLSNAVKYTEKGFVRFSAAGERLSDTEIKLTFTVEDSGVGIRTEDMSSLFGDFVRLEEKRHGSVDGAGLGLAITRSLCLSMGGEITVTSEYGKGAVFTVTLPQGVTDWRPMSVMPEKW